MPFVQDAPILERSQGKLEWVVLDEAHTYIGSQAAASSFVTACVECLRCSPGMCVSSQHPCLGSGICSFVRRTRPFWSVSRLSNSTRIRRTRRGSAGKWPISCRCGWCEHLAYIWFLVADNIPAIPGEIQQHRIPMKYLIRSISWTYILCSHPQAAATVVYRI